MPTYVYECAKCGDEFELWQSFAEDALKKHPECGGKVTKVIQPVGIVLKGSGFYKNDSRSGSRNGRPKKTESGERSGDKSGSSGTDSGSGSGDSSSGSNDSASTSTKPDAAKKSDGGSTSSADKKSSTPASKST